MGIVLVYVKLHEESGSVLSSSQKFMCVCVCFMCVIVRVVVIIIVVGF